jgi:SAM-dependent methyltransferase
VTAIVAGTLDRVHDRFVLNRRVRVIVEHLAQLVPQGSDLLDVGSGDGAVALTLMKRRPDIRAQGIDVFVRGATHIPVQEFDGVRIPMADKSIGTVMMVDVLHHTDNPAALIAEASRVARDAVVIKDHLADGFLAVPTLAFMDRVGNVRHGVRLPYNYLTRAQWDDAFARAGLRVDAWRSRLGLYPAPATWLFDRGLHFATRLVPK